MGSWKLKPVLAVAVSFGMMAVVGEAAADEPLSWSKGAVPANAVLAAGPNEQPMHICRLPMVDKILHPGKLVNGNCYVGYAGKEIKGALTAAEVLGSSAPVGWADVKDGKVPAGALSAGVAGDVTMHFCRAKHEGKSFHAGKEWRGNCYYGYGGKEIKTAEFQVMGLTKVAAAPGAAAKVAGPAAAAPPAPTAAPVAPTKPSAPAAGADPLIWSKGTVPPNAVIAAGTKEQPMHICRLPMADKNLHPGKAGKDNCYVGFNGKEIKAPLKDAEILGASAPVGWTEVKGGNVPANALSAGTVNGVTMHFCRTMHEGKTAVAGKEYKGNCYYGYGGKEIKTAEFQVMGLMKVAAAPAAPPPAAAPVKPAASAAAPATAAAPVAADGPLSWTKGVVPSNAITINAKGMQTVHICRISMPDKSLIPGTMMNDQCAASHNGQVIISPLKKVEILGSSASIDWVKVTGGKVPANALKAGVVGGVPIHICLRNISGAFTVGRVIEGSGSCQYASGAAAKKTAEFSVMTLQTAPPTVAAAPAKSAAQTATPAPAAAAEAVIRVGGVWYGRNCRPKEIPSGADKFALSTKGAPGVAKACNGKQTCDYKVDASVLGDWAPKCQKEFKVEYSCGPGTVGLEVSVPGEANGKTLRLACKQPSAPK